MRRAAVLMLFVIVVCHVSAQEAVDNSHYFELTVNTGVSAGVYEMFVNLGVQGDFLINNAFSLCGRFDFHLGLSFRDFYMGTFFLIKYGWFYAGPGMVVRLLRGGIPYDSQYTIMGYMTPPLGFAATAGASFPLITVGPGRFGIHCSVDWYPTDTPSSLNNPNTLVQLFRSFPPGIAEIFIYAKPSLDVSYLISF
ncbi:MAG: hypothetical protein JW969_17305 [Spirochaetales bacterium]|nr:hypothetical protein [Spirochaetales bacterium]